jgi:hypothetical protein
MFYYDDAIFHRKNVLAFVNMAAGLQRLTVELVFALFRRGKLNKVDQSTKADRVFASQ